MIYDIYLCRYCGSDDSVCGEVLCRINETRRQSPQGPDTAFAPGAGMAAAPDHSNVSPAEETDNG